MSLGCPECGSLITDHHYATCSRGGKKMKELKSYKMTDGGSMVLYQETNGTYTVEQYTSSDISRWYKHFEKASDADVEYEKWRGHAAGS